MLPFSIAVAALLAACEPRPPGVIVVEYGESLCPACVEQKRVLEQLQSEGVPRFVYVELMGNQTSVQEFVSLYERLGLYGVEGGYLVPLLIIVMDGKVKGAAIGVRNASKLQLVIAQASSVTGVKVWSSRGVYEVSDAANVAFVQSIVEGGLAEVAALPLGKTAIQLMQTLNPFHAFSGSSRFPRLTAELFYTDLRAATRAFHRRSAHSRSLRDGVHLINRKPNQVKFIFFTFSVNDGHSKTNPDPECSLGNVQNLLTRQEKGSFM